MSNYGCSDRMCGAIDCSTCHPGNHYGDICANCDAEYEECDCDEFETNQEDDDDDFDHYDPDEEDRWADEAAAKYEQEVFDRADRC